MPEHKKTKKKRTRNTQIPSLSSSELIKNNSQLDHIKDAVDASVNTAELQKALDKWLKDNINENSITTRDLGILKTIITEYLDAFMVFGYNTKSERIIIQHFTNPKDRDAMMEFLKTIFLKQQHENFLDEGEDYE